MSSTDARARHERYQAIENLIGTDPADTLMGLLPAQGANELVTTTDLRVTTAELRAEMADIRSEMADLRTEMADLRTELKTDMAELRTEFRTDLAGLRSDMNDRFREQGRLLVFGLVGSMLTLGSINMTAIVLAT